MALWQFDNSALSLQWFCSQIWLELISNFGKATIKGIALWHYGITALQHYDIMVAQSISILRRCNNFAAILIRHHLISFCPVWKLYKVSLS